MVSSIISILCFSSLFAGTIQQCNQTLHNSLVKFLLPQAMAGYSDSSALPDVSDKVGFLGHVTLTLKRGTLRGLTDVKASGDVKITPYSSGPIEVTLGVRFNKLRVTFDYKISGLFITNKGTATATTKQTEMRVDILFEGDFCSLDLKSEDFGKFGDFDVKVSSDISSSDLKNIANTFNKLVKEEVQKKMRKRLRTMYKDMQSYCFFLRFSPDK